jgi:predicted ATPase
MLKELKLENFRGFANHTIPFKPLNVIVGSNNAGKSSVVEALRITSFAVNRFKSLTYRRAPEWLDISGNYGVSPSLKNAEINFDSICNQYNNDQPTIITANFIEGSSVTTYLNREAKVHSVIKSPKGKIISSRGEALKLDLPSVNILPQVGPLQRDEFILDVDYVKNAIGSALSPMHFRNQLNIFKEYFPEFQHVVANTWAGVMIQQLIINGQLPKALLSLQVRNENFVAEVASMGHGLQMWLQVIWFLTLFSKSDIIILDEPDVYMHADLQKRLIRIVKNKFPQVILTTHSIEIMSEVEPDDILIIDKSTRKSSFANNIPAVQRVIESTGSFQNVNLTRLWKAKKFLLVEGEDLKYLKTIQNKVFPHSPVPIDSIPNMSIGGWSGWNYAIGSSMLLINSLKEKLVIYCILDSDYHSEDEIQKRYEEAKNKEIELHILSRKEIENYFIVPEAIQRLIIKRSKGEYTPSTTKIKGRLNKISSLLKNDVTDCIANEILQKNKQLGLQNANRKAREIVSEVEMREGNLLNIISGKEIITRMSKWAQSNFSVSFSPTALLAELNKSEINDEILSVIKAIETNGSF